MCLLYVRRVKKRNWSLISGKNIAAVLRDKFPLANTKTFPSYDQKEMLFGYWLACLLACNDYTADDGDGATLYWKYFRLFVLLQSYKVNIIIALLNGQEQHQHGMKISYLHTRKLYVLCINIQKQLMAYNWAGRDEERQRMIKTLLLVANLLKTCEAVLGDDIVCCKRSTFSEFNYVIWIQI